MIYYCQIYIRNTLESYTWQTIEFIELCTRVIVNLRNKKRFGIVIKASTIKPSYETKDIIEILESNFIPSEYLELAEYIAKYNYTKLEKVLSLIIPETYLTEKQPEKYNEYYNLHLNYKKHHITGSQQQKAIQLLEKTKDLNKNDFKKEIPLATIKTLLQKEIITVTSGVLVGVKQKHIINREDLHQLTLEQQKAYKQILENKKPTMLFGVTGSGKTEIYKQLAWHYYQKNKNNQTLFLLPEIALTPQLIAEFTKVFSEKIAVWHSHLTENEKIQEWKRCQTGVAKILIGARSAILVPLPYLKCIILDEEHEWTYKNEQIPRFWTHDAAEYLAKKYQATLVFGSATPKLETYTKAAQGFYQRVNLPNRVNKQALPSIEFVNLSNEAKKGNFSPLSDSLKNHLKHILSVNRQAVLFLNKRGYAGATLCKHCGHDFSCPNCSSSMKMHRPISSNKNQVVAKFVCHFCGHLEIFPKSCPECHKSDFVLKGWGTQQLEQCLQEFLPEARILRADADTTTGKYDFAKIMKNFSEHRFDILLGTQMIAKGLDFAKVDFVGIILADVGLTLPDFRAEERVYQLLIQVAGRAGRREIEGKVCVQTYRPLDIVFRYFKNHDTENFLEWQMKTREQNKFPPFYKMAKLTITHTEKEKAFAQSQDIWKQCQKLLGKKEVENKTDIFIEKNNLIEKESIIKRKILAKILKENQLFSKLSQKMLPLRFLGVDPQTKIDIPLSTKKPDSIPVVSRIFSSDEIEVNIAPAFFPKMHGKFHFHLFLKAKNSDLLAEFLEYLDLSKKIRVDIDPATLL